MRRIHIRRVTVQSFRAFQERQSSPELPTSGLVGLRGHNKDTGGSSGAGKSSVAYAIAYAFDFLPFSATSQQNWHTEVPMQVELELDTPEGQAILRRGKETSLTWNGETVKGSAKAVTDAVRKMWGGVDSDLIKALTFRKQKDSRGRFLTMKDAERKEFLTMLLGLGEIEEQISESVKRSNAFENEANEQMSIIIALNQQLQEPVKPDLEDLGLLENQIHDLRSEEMSLFAKKQNAQTELELLTAELEKERPHPSMYVRIGLAGNGQPLRDYNTQLEEAKERLQRAKSLEAAHRNRIKEQAAKLKPLMDGLREIASRYPRIVDDVARNETDILSLKDSKCQTCFRQWDKAAEEMARKTRALDTLKDMLSASVAARAKLDSRKAEYDQLMAEAEEYTLPSVAQLQSIVEDLTQKKTQEIARLQSLQKLAEVEGQRDYAVALEAFEKKRRELLSNQESKLLALTRELEGVQNLSQILKGKFNVTKQARKLYETAVQSYEALRNRITVKDQEYSQLKKKANEEADYAAMVKGFLIAYFEEVLNEISIEANEILKSIPNTPTTTVQFVTETQTAKGVTRQEIKPVVTKNGVTIDLESGVSGGQMESVELAVDLSVVKVIGGRTGVQPGFMIFDESFSAHCLPVKQACMAVLAQAAKDAMILVVDHATELQDSFTSFVDVESENDVSRFKS